MPGCLIERALGGANVTSGLPECVGSGPGVSSTEVAVAVVVGGTALIGEAGPAELDERLFERARRTEQFPTMP